MTYEQKLVLEILSDPQNMKIVEKLNKKKEGLTNYLLGMTMKEIKNANPKITKDIIQEELSKV